MPRAHIVVHAPASRDEAFRFDLIDLDGPRRGRRLADFDVPATYAGADLAPTPNADDAREVRARLVTYGTRNGYRVVDDLVANPAGDPGRQAQVVITRRPPAARTGARRRGGT
jgi:hypothetical protein